MEKIEILPNVFIQAEFIEDGANMVENYIDLDKYQSSWHDKLDKVLHLTPLLICKKKSYGNATNDYENDIDTKGSFYVGSLTHGEFQDGAEFKDGQYVREFPLSVEIEFKGDEFALKIPVQDAIIYLVAKIDLIHNLEHRLEDLKTFDHFFLPKDVLKVDLKYYLQVIILTFIANHTYYEKDPLKEVYLVCISKKNYYTKIITIEYTEEIGLACYSWLINRVKEMYAHLQSGTVPDGEISMWCKYCNWIDTCAEGREHLKDILEPISLESTRFKKLHPDKKPYYRRDGKWNKTKLFKEYEASLTKSEN